jgi:signal transduction histidine kinase
MGALIRALDWSKTSIGAADTWSPALRTMVRFLLANRFPLLLWWGPDYVSIYNDPYRPVLGKKHPWALGLPVRECWSEIWHILQPLIDTPFNGGPATWNEDIGLEINRHGFVEETHFTIAYSPVPDETTPTGIGGVLATVHEITEKVIGERRIVALRDLGVRAGDVKSVDQACGIAAHTLSGHDKDIPFVLLYLADNDRRQARLAAASGVAVGNDIAPETIDLSDAQDRGWPLAAALQTDTLQVVSGLAKRFASVPPGPWSDPPNTAVVVPIPSNRAHEPTGALIAGVSARLKLDQYYKDFFELVRTQIATAIGHARAYEDERKRAEALAEIDRAKTIFFSNVSHEFRTPLTLMLGPVQDFLTETHGPLTSRQRASMEILQRNAGRLLKLVNALLDFSRIEAGRTQASFRQTDVAAVTRELAGAFRSAIEHAGIRFEVHCEAIAEPVFLDRDMWEKIVLNLLSNALKFTFDGVIRLDLRAADGRVELIVQDTGTGIPSHELPGIFERFHRVEGARARTHEGTGIGLALTHELVRLHGGTITANSAVGEGTTFVVRIPVGRAHLPEDRVSASPSLVSTAIGSAPFVDEAAQWVTEPLDESDALTTAGARADGERILVVDDNVDMREYLSQLLRDWTVTAAPNGLAALDIARATTPHLIVSDVMMPGLDGFALLRELRTDPRTRGIPVLMLSARAGEEARVSALGAGADDYVVKPFSARELRARVASLLNLSRARREAEAANRTKDEFLAMLGHELRNPLAPILTALQLMTLKGSDTLLKERTIIDRQVRHLVRLVDDLLDVSRIARGKIELRHEAVDMADVVAAAVEAVSPLLEERRHQFTVRVAQGLVVMGDATRLTQIVTNVLSNAAKYTEPSGNIEILGDLDQETIELRVKDTGIGIAPEMLPRIFDMFTQERQTFHRAEGGLGLGLTIVKSLVDLHGGRIAAHSEGLGHGAEIIVRLPKAAVAVTPGRGRDHSREMPVTQIRRRILIVDDNVDAAHTMADALGLAGYETRVAFDGPGALDLTSVFQPDAVLLDLGLPLMDGYEVAQEIMAGPSGCTPILVAVTGYGQISDQNRTRAAGFSGHVVKPIDVPQLVTVLERLLTPEPAN